MDSSNISGAEEKVIFWISEINKNTENFKREFSKCSKDQLSFKPAADIWSIAENIQHIIEVNKSYFPIFSQVMNQTYKPSWSSRFGFLNNLVGNLILKSVSEDRKKKIKTFALWIPKQIPSAEDILAQFESHQKEMIGWLQNLKPYIDNETVINSPANKLISYTIDDAIKIIIMHEKRHFNQAKETKQMVT